MAGDGGGLAEAARDGTRESRPAAAGRARLTLEAAHGTAAGQAGRRDVEQATLVRAVAALSVTQILGWGTTFYLPAVLAPAMSAGTGLPVGLIFGGVSLMLLTGGLVAPAAGRAFARRGTRPFMVGGSCLVAMGLLVLSAAQGPVSFALGWLILGLAMPGALGQAASAAIVQIAPDRARGAITILLLFSGMTSTASWPILIALDEAIGWRTSLQVFAALHLVVAAPLHLLGLPALARPTSPPGDERTAAPAPAAPAAVAPAAVPVRGAFGLAATAFALVGFVTWGIPLQLILILRDQGHTQAEAVAIGALFGPGQLLARLFELAGGHRLGILTVALIATGLVPCALGLLLVGGGTVPVALGFVLSYGFAAGLVSIARVVVPLRLFGAAAYAAMSGRLALPQNIAFGLSPLALATIREAGGSQALLAVAIAASASACAAVALLVARVRAAERRAG